MGRHPWHSAVKAYDSTAPLRCPRKSTLFPDALSPSPPLPAAILDEPAPVAPADVSHPAPVAYAIPNMLDCHIAAKRASQLHKYCEMERLHTSAWYNLSSNKEANEWGSHASVSVEGLCHNTSENATTDLKRMLHITHQHFAVLHTPRTMTMDRSHSQYILLSEIATEYGPKPGPSNVHSGEFSMAEILDLRSKMPNTAPGPDGIQCGFYKALASKLDLLISSGYAYTSFWEVFHSLANDVCPNGSNRCNFKLANLSLFYKKCDPTLVSNYHPISSMNTDCKMYTNLINGRICPWAIKKIHSDQAGFIPGRLITDHTRLASEVAHLANSTGVDSYIVSLDQAKAYDCTDLSWLLRVLNAMGIPDNLVSLIDDITSGCRTHVRINSGLSTSYILNLGLRQGNPLSPMLYDFSIEPLGMRMRQHLRGISCCSLPPAKLLQYADDMNLFASIQEDFPLIRRVLDDSSLAIGCKFNLEKTDILVIRSQAHCSAPSHDDILSCFDEAFIFPENTPLRVLGIWIGSPDRAAPCWRQILTHIKKLIRQWNAISASILNRVLLAKALMLSRCYYLLDGNDIPPILLRCISNAIQ